MAGTVDIVAISVVTGGESVACTSVTIDYPPGVGGARCTVEVVGAGIAIDPDERIEVQMGYFSEDGPTYSYSFFSDRLERVEHTTEPRQDRATVSYVDAYAARFLIAPLEREAFGQDGDQGLSDLLEYVYNEKLGFQHPIHNLPGALPCPALEFTYLESWDATAQSVISIWDPLVTVDTEINQPYIFSRERYVSGTPLIISINLHELEIIEDDFRPIVNQAEISWNALGRGGAAFPTDAGDPVGGSLGYGGAITDTTAGLTFLGQVTARDLAPGGSEVVEASFQGWPSGAGGALTRKVYIEWHENSESPDATNRVLDRTVTRQWKYTEDGGAAELQMEAVDQIYYLPDTSFEVVSGHELRTSALCKVPSVGRIWVDDVLVEQQLLRFERRTNDGTRDWRKVGGVKLTFGVVLVEGEPPAEGAPDQRKRTPLYRGTLNDTVDTSLQSAQSIDPDRSKVVKEGVEAVTPVGRSQLATTVTEIDRLEDAFEFATTYDTLGRDKLTSEPEVLKEVIRDLPSISLYGARAAVQIDGTRFGSTAQDARNALEGTPTNAGYEWAVLRARELFKRSGTPIRRVRSTVPKLIGRLYRGGLVRLSKRGGQELGTYLVEGFTVSARVTEDGGIKAETVIVGVEVNT